MSSFAVGHLYATSTPRRIGENQAFTGIWKDPIKQAAIDEEGIKGDIQVDKRVHGGAEKALHQYAIASYVRLHAAFPELAARIPIGSMGENFTIAGMHEDNVHIGDIYRIGSALVQVSQPRNPCWKINSKFDDERLAKFIAAQHIPGWYYRVLEAGQVELGDSMELVERFNPMSLRNFLAAYEKHRPNFLILRSMARTQGLTLSWQVKIQQRMEVLQRL
ncbi:MAG TPA: MOSC domain-containing protein [Thiolinea sp.]|nr:MOSC domain-containing protein [Thiolinea sp.]